MYRRNLVEGAAKMAGDTVQSQGRVDLSLNEMEIKEDTLDLTCQCDKIWGTKIDSAGQTVQEVVDQVTDAGQKAFDDVCKNVQDTGEKATKSLTTQMNPFGQSEEKNTST